MLVLLTPQIWMLFISIMHSPSLSPLKWDEDNVSQRKWQRHEALVSKILTAGTQCPASKDISVMSSSCGCRRCEQPFGRRMYSSLMGAPCTCSLQGSVLLWGWWQLGCQWQCPEWTGPSSFAGAWLSHRLSLSVGLFLGQGMGHVAPFYLTLCDPVTLNSQKTPPGQLR